jgi:hypothetical protein
MAYSYTSLLAVFMVLTLITIMTEAAGPGTTLQKGHFWIRAVTKPSKVSFSPRCTQSLTVGQRMKIFTSTSKPNPSLYLELRS